MIIVELKLKPKNKQFEKKTKVNICRSQKKQKKMTKAKQTINHPQLSLRFTNGIKSNFIHKKQKANGKTIQNSRNATYYHITIKTKPKRIKK